MRAGLAVHGSIEVDGYTLVRELARAIDSCNAAAMPLPPCPVHWFANTGPAPAQLAAGVQRIARSWAERDAAELVEAEFAGGEVDVFTRDLAAADEQQARLQQRRLGRLEHHQQRQHHAGGADGEDQDADAAPDVHLGPHRDQRRQQREAERERRHDADQRGAYALARTVLVHAEGAHAEDDHQREGQRGQVQAIGAEVAAAVGEPQRRRQAGGRQQHQQLQKQQDECHFGIVVIENPYHSLSRQAVGAPCKHARKANTSSRKLAFRALTMDKRSRPMSPTRQGVGKCTIVMLLYTPKNCHEI
ncbi:MAG: hypothetical protein ACXWVG_07610 [Telluria sp.]